MSPPHAKAALLCALLAGIALALVLGTGTDPSYAVQRDPRDKTVQAATADLGGRRNDQPDDSPAEHDRRVERVEEQISSTRVRVVDAVTCKPIPGVQVFVTTRMGRILGDRTTDESGHTGPLPEPRRMHGVVAWHPDYQIGGRIAREQVIEVQLNRLDHLRVAIKPQYEVTHEWLATCDKSVHFEFRNVGNPVQSGPNYLEFKVFKSLGLDSREWPVRDSVAVIPRYLNADGRVGLVARQTLPSRSDEFLPGPAAKPTTRYDRQRENLKEKQSMWHRVATTTTEIEILPKPDSPHALIIHYTRLRDHPTGDVHAYLHNVYAQYSTFAVHGNTFTVKIFDLEKKTYIPILVFKSENGGPISLECDAVKVDGRTEFTLTPKQPARLSVHLTGLDEPVTVDDKPVRDTVHLRRIDGPSTPGGPDIDHARRRHEWTQLSPGEYEVYARGKDRISPSKVVSLKPGEHREIELDMQPLCEFRLVIPRSGLWNKLVIRETTTGYEKTLRLSNWQQLFHYKTQGKDVVLIGKGNSLALPYGIYTFTATRRDRTWCKTLRLDTPRRRIRIE